ncbi:hypothetical protein ABIC65_002088 [Sphingomonas trueperi]|uniref:endonuclease/exonuclease/phosphatase family protein n=1 Tax=Sphingomonas trueperi TaxID=53317 RepID=UPI00339215E1
MSKIHWLRWKFSDPIHRKFVAERLIALKTALDAQIRRGTSESSLRLATWNLMHFGDGGGYDRTLESMLYIAEIIDHFDLVAVQEVNRDLTKLEALIDDHLGPEWDYLVTDTTGGRPSEAGPGNNERLAFLYRKAKVQFCKEAGEIVLPGGQQIAAPGEAGTTEKVQFARTPFAVAFRAGWLKFKLCTVHIFYGNGEEGMTQRRAEIERIAQFLADRQADEAEAMVKRATQRGWNDASEAGWDSNFILLGDFNIISPEHETMQALLKAGFHVPTQLEKTNLGSTHHYDQIAIKAGHPHLKVLSSGVFDMLTHVYRDEDADQYVDVAKPPILAKDSKGNPRPRGKQVEYFRQYYRKHQMSDHKLLWCELCVDYAEPYLKSIAEANAP